MLEHCLEASLQIKEEPVELSDYQIQAQDHQSMEEDIFLNDSKLALSSTLFAPGVGFSSTLDELSQSEDEDLDLLDKEPLTDSSIEELVKTNTLSGNHICIACNMKCSSATNLLNHLKLHRENYFFCRFNCGAKFRHPNLCIRHEYYEEENNPSLRGLINTEQINLTSFQHLCSLCWKVFNSEVHLHAHWFMRDYSCYRIMQNVIGMANCILKETVSASEEHKIKLIPKTQLTLKCLGDKVSNKVSRGLKNCKSVKDCRVTDQAISSESEMPIEQDGVVNDNNKVDMNEIYNMNMTNLSKIYPPMSKYVKNKSVLNRNDARKAINGHVNGSKRKVVNKKSIRNRQSKNLLSTMPKAERVVETSETLTTCQQRGGSRRNFVISKDRLIAIENQPEKKKIIEDMIKQMKRAEYLEEERKRHQLYNNIHFSEAMETQQFLDSGFATDTTDIDLQREESNRIEPMISKVDTKNTLKSDLNSRSIRDMHEETSSSSISSSYFTSELTLPPTHSSSISTRDFCAVPSEDFQTVTICINKEISEIRQEFPSHTFRFKCSYCDKEYDMKHHLKNHLVRFHNLAKKDFVKVMIEMKAFKLNTIPSNDAVSESCDVKYFGTEIENFERGSSDVGAGKLCSSKKTIRPKSKRLKNMISSLNDSIKNYSSSSSTSGISVSGEDTSNSETATSSYICEKCAWHCPTLKLLEQHIKTNCGTKPQYSCPHCLKNFSSTSTLNGHLSIHTGEMPYHCEYCGKRFRTRGQVTVHHRTHTGERPFVCQICSSGFTHRETFISHLSRHIGLKRYKCYGCDKKFACISALRTHRKIRQDTCGKVKMNARAIGPRVRVVKGSVHFEPQPEVNHYLRTEDPHIH